MPLVSNVFSEMPLLCWWWLLGSFFLVFGTLPPKKIYNTHTPLPCFLSSPVLLHPLRGLPLWEVSQAEPSLKTHISCYFAALEVPASSIKNLKKWLFSTPKRTSELLLSFLSLVIFNFCWVDIVLLFVLLFYWLGNKFLQAMKEPRSLPSQIASKISLPIYLALLFQSRPQKPLSFIHCLVNE